MIEVSGREKHIVMSALAYAVAAIESLPSGRQAASDMADMKEMLSALSPSDTELDTYIATARRHLFPSTPS